VMLVGEQVVFDGAALLHRIPVWRGLGHCHFTKSARTGVFRGALDTDGKGNIGSAGHKPEDFHT